jgi:glycosyltransferase involved in cell wall biosynthesis
MNIVIDLRCLNDYPFTGVANYTISVVDALLQSDRQNNYLLFNNSYKIENEKLDCLLKGWLKNDNVRYFNAHWPNKLLNFLLKIKILKLDIFLRKKNLFDHVDCWYLPNMNYLCLSDGVRVLLTVHDLSFHLFPGFFNYKQRLWHRGINYQKLFKRANYLLAVSRATAFDLRRLGVDNFKIKVFPLGVDNVRFYLIDNNERLDFVKKKYNLPKRFFVFVATLEARKNLRLLLAAWLDLSVRDRQECPLYLIGRKTAYWQKISREQWGIRQDYDYLWEGLGVNILSYVPDDDLPVFYNLAEALVYPSCYEGFGLPPLEALSCNCPVIVGRNSALLENFADALTVDTDNPRELTNLLFDFIHGKIDRANALPKNFGLEKYSWSAYADSLLNLIKSL